jgi:hypothetical protein
MGRNLGIRMKDLLESGDIMVENEEVFHRRSEVYLVLSQVDIDRIIIICPNGSLMKTTGLTKRWFMYSSL